MTVSRPFGFVLVIIVNSIAEGVPLGGQTSGEISDKYPSLFTPAGYVFWNPPRVAAKTTT